MAKDHIPKEFQKQFARPRPIEAEAGRSAADDLRR